MSGAWNGTTLYSKVHETTDDGLWPEVNSAKNAPNKRGRKRKEAQKQRMKKEEATWGASPAQAPKKESSVRDTPFPMQPSREDDEDWGSFKAPQLKKENSIGSTSLSTQPTSKQDDWGLWEISSTQQDSTEHPSKTKMQDIFGGDKSLGIEEDVIWDDPFYSKRSTAQHKPLTPPDSTSLSSITAPSPAKPTEQIHIQIRETPSGIEGISLPNPTNPQNPICLLLALPTELQRDIVDLLPPHPKLLLRLTCHRFHTLVPAPSHADLLAIERTPWARARALWACAHCVRLRPARHFAVTMVRGARGLHGKEPHKRFCVECGLRPDPRTRASLYAPGSEIVVGGCRHVFCRECRVYGRELGGKGTGVCKGCHVKLGLEGAPRGVLVGVNPTREKRARRAVGRRSEGWWISGGEYGYQSDDYDFPDGYDTEFWESYDPS